ncbi:hypothetical protein [Croceibacterium mercuriale]|nr:hypothetical protein [Croceibacterium mercuriale]
MDVFLSLVFDRTNQPRHRSGVMLPTVQLAHAKVKLFTRSLPD